MSRQAPVARPPKDAKASKVKESKSAAVRAALANPTRRQLTKWQREQRQKRLVLYSAIGLVALVALVLAFGSWRELVMRPNEPAAEVGDQVIPLGALAVRLHPQLVAIDNEIVRVQNQSAPTSSGAGASSQQLQMLYSQRLGAVDQVLGDMIDDELIAREAQRRGLTVRPDEIDARIRTDMARQKAFAAGPAPTPATGPAPGPSPTPTAPPTLTADDQQQTYQDFLNRINFTDEQYRRYVEAQILRDKLRDSLSADIPATQEQVHARRITLGTQEDATAALAQLRSGEATFEDLARDKSKDLTSQSQGGDLGWLPRGIESTQFDDQAFRLGLGELGDPVTTPQGWEIIQVLEKGQRALTPEQLDRLKNKAFDQWLRTARDDGSVRRELDKDKRDWVMRQAGGARSTTSTSQQPGF
ncbi:MAG TPA: peptidylprolyl isomerase [Chloroflexota bacterium]|nr:peptidylprolyl isomerase [Chloroflexota bacterium]